MEVRKEYESLEKKYKLPKFDEINKEFELVSIELEISGIFIKAILRLILNRISVFLGYIEPALSAVPVSPHVMIEMSNLSKDDKKEIYNHFKQLSYLYHKLCESDLEDEKAIAENINWLFKKWGDIKKNQKRCMEKITKAWLEKDVFIDKEEKIHYMG